GELALVAAAGSLAQAGADAAALALRPLVLVNALIDFVEAHVRLTPRSRSTSAWVRSRPRALIAALTTVTWLLVLKLFVMTFLMPAASQTARTAAPAITPVPAS